MTALLLALLALQDDAAVDQTLSEFGKQWLKDKTSAGRAGLVAELAKTQHEKVVSKLSSLVTSEDKQVRLAAAAALGTMTGTPELKKSAAKALMYALSSGANVGDVDMKIAVLAAFGTLGEESAEKKVKEHFEDKNVKIAVAAVTAAGQMKCKGLVEPLIAVLRECEQEIKKANTVQQQSGQKLGQTDPTKKAPATPAKDPAREKRDRVNALFPTSQGALATLTGHSLKTSDDYEKWWAANKAAFEAPK